MGAKSQTTTSSSNGKVTESNNTNENLQKTILEALQNSLEQQSRTEATLLNFMKTVAKNDISSRTAELKAEREMRQKEHEDFQKDLDKSMEKVLKRVTVLTESFASFSVAIANANSESEIKMAQELGAEAYVDLAKTRSVSREQICEGFLQTISAVASEAIKTYAPIHATQAKASLLRAENDRDEKNL
tara:strand:+ start:74 stop:637 length:564 start_codon:yes stop_codon:yes gene_type:complete